MALADLRFPLQVHFRQPILHYHHRTVGKDYPFWGQFIEKPSIIPGCPVNRTVALDNVHLVELAMVDGFALDQTAIKDRLQHYLGDFLHDRLDSSSSFTSLTLCLL